MLSPLFPYDLPQPAPQHAERSHHPTSPSSLQTLEASPCFLNKASANSDAAERGTKQHEAADRGEDHHELTDEEAFAVAQTMDAIAAAERDLGPNAIVVKEAYWHVDDQPMQDITGKVWRGTTGGFADVVVVAPDGSCAVVLDWKFGRYAVEPAKTNLQGIAYALGVFHWAAKRKYNMREVTVAFFSPHIDAWTQHTFTLLDVETLLLRVRATVGRALATREWIKADPSNLSLYHPRTTSCTFCGRIGVCPAVAKLALQISEKYRPLTVPLSDIRGLALLDPEVAKQGIQLAGVVANWASEYRKRLTEKAIEHPDFVPDGYKLTMSYPRKVVDVKKVIEMAKEVLSEEQIEAILDLPITPLEKAVGEQAPRGQKGKAVEEFARRLEESGAVEKSPIPVVALRMVSGGNKE